MSFSTADVAPGDVLLFHGKGFISWAIRTFDGTEVNHAAVVLPGGLLAEAGGRGLQQRAIPVPGGGEFIRVHRLKASTDLDPVVARANAYLEAGHRYAYHQIVLLGVLTLIRRVPLPRLARRLVRSALDHAATALLDLLPVGATWMICSEYVYRSYAEAVAGDADPYELPIHGVSFGGTATTADADQSLLEWAVDNVRDVRVAPPVVFAAAPPPADPVQRLAAIEADLAPLIADYAEQLRAAGEIADHDLPPLIDPSFGPPPPLPPQPTDDEMLAAVASFSTAFTAARSGAGAVPPAFGVGATIGGAALKGALEGIRDVTVDPNFVTPGDLLNSPAFDFVGRLG